MSEVQEAQRELFRRVKPLTVSLVDRGGDGRAALTSLSSILAGSRTEVVIPLGDYIAFALLAVLRDSQAREGEVEQTLVVFKQMRVMGAELPRGEGMLTELLVSLAKIVDRKNLPEDPVRSTAALALQDIFRTPSAQQRLVSQEFVLVMSLALAAPLDLVREGVSLNARAAGLDAAAAWLSLFTDAFPDRVIAVLPGITSACTSVLRNDATTPRRLLVSALTLFEAALRATMADRLNEGLLGPASPFAAFSSFSTAQSSESDATISSSSTVTAPSTAATVVPASGPRGLPPAERSLPWLRTASAHLTRLLSDRLPALSVHTDGAIRTASGTLAATALCECARSLGASAVATCADVLASLTENETDSGISDVSPLARAIKHLGATDASFPFDDVIAGAAASRLTLLVATILGAAHDDAKLVAVRRAAGYLALANDVARPAVTRALIDASTDVIAALRPRTDRHVMVLEVVTDTSSPAPSALPTTPDQVLRSMPPTRLAHVGAENITRELLNRVFTHVGTVSDSVALIDHFSGYLLMAGGGDAILSSAAAAILCAHVVAGSRDDQAAVVLLDAVSQSSAWDDGEDEGDVVFSQDGARAEQRVALLRCIAVCVSRVSRRTLDARLLKCLYPLLLCLETTDHQRVTAAASIALDALSAAIGAPSATDLLLRCADFIAHSISARIRHVTRPSGAAAIGVLRAALRVAGIRIAPLIEDVILDLIDVLDEYHSDADVPLLIVPPIVDYINVVASHLSQRASRTGQPKAQEARDKPDMGDDVMDDVDAATGFAAHHARMASAPPEEEPTRPDDPADPLAELTSHDRRLFLTVKRAVERTCSLLSVPSARLQTRVLSLISGALPVLSIAPGELRPLLHSTWGAIVNRLDDNSRDVVASGADEAVLSFLQRLILEQDDNFFHDRIESDVLPRLAKRLPRLVSALDAHSASDVFSAPHRLVVAFLNFLTNLFDANWFAPSYETMTRYTDALLPCLDSALPPQVQKTACDFYRAVARRDADFVWAFLSRVAASDAVFALYPKDRVVKTMRYSEITGSGQKEHDQQMIRGMAAVTMDIRSAMTQGKETRKAVGPRGGAAKGPSVEEVLHVVNVGEWTEAQWSLLPSKYGRTLNGRIYQNADMLAKEL